MGEAPRILVFRGGSIGDFVLTVPALTALRNRWPDAYIELAGYPHIARLAEACGLVNRVTSLVRADIARFFSLRPEISPEQAEHLSSFDLVISYLYDPDGTVKKNMENAGARQVVYGSPVVSGGHASDYLMKPLEEMAVYPDREEPAGLALPEEARERGRRRVEQVGARVVAIHPGSGGKHKIWPLENFIRLADDMAAVMNVVPLFMLGEVELEREAEFRGVHKRFPVFLNMTLLEAAENLAACSGYVGNDSGITHLAASVGIPVVALFGPTDPRVWGPRGQHVSIVRSRPATPEGLRRLPVETVLQAVARTFGP